MSGIRKELSVQRAYIWCISTEAYFHAISCKKTRSIQDTLKIQMLLSQMTEPGIFCQGEDGHAHMSSRKVNGNDRLKGIPLSQNTSYVEDSQLLYSSVLSMIYDIRVWTTSRPTSANFKAAERIYFQIYWFRKSNDEARWGWIKIFDH